MKNTKDTIANLESIIATLSTRIEELGEDLGDHLSAADLAIAIECQPEEEEPEFSTIAQCQSWRRGKLREMTGSRNEERERERADGLEAELEALLARANAGERRGFQLAIAALRGEPCRPHITAAWWLEGVENRKWGKADKC